MARPEHIDAAESAVMVFAPCPTLMITAERKGEEPDVHLHPGGQGFWLARMIAELGASVTLCGTFGGETGNVIRSLIEGEGIRVHTVATEAANPASMYDRRGREQVTIAEMPHPALARHEVDELYGAALVEGLSASVCVLGGPALPTILPADVYRRLAADLVTNGKVVVADLSEEPLIAVLGGGVSVVKISHEQLVADGHATSTDDADLIQAIERLRAQGAGVVVVSRADRPSLATLDGDVVEVVAPTLEPLNMAGAGDSMTAGIVAGLARGYGLDRALRLGAAAGTLNVTRRGLGTGERRAIEQLAEHVGLRPFAGAESEPQVTTPDQLADRARQQ